MSFVICWFTSCVDAFVCSCQRVGLACSNYHSIGWNTPFTSPAFVHLMLVVDREHSSEDIDNSSVEGVDSLLQDLEKDPSVEARPNSISS